MAALGLAGLPPFGLFRGQTLMDESAGRSGYPWLPYLAIIAAALTGGALLRVTGRAFLGWGRPLGRNNRTHSPAGAESEIEGGHQDISWVMLLPPVALTAVGIALGLLPGVVSTAVRSAWLFENRRLYIAKVFGIHAGPIGPSPASLPEASHLWRGLLSAGLALLIALVALRTPDSVRSRMGRAWEAAIRPLRAAQSGHPGDYVTWITCGAAVLGLLFVRFL